MKNLFDHDYDIYCLLVLNLALYQSLRRFYDPKGELTLYHTIPTFNNPKEKGSGKHYGKKGENAGNQHFILFQKCFLFYRKEKLSF